MKSSDVAMATQRETIRLRKRQLWTLSLPNVFTFRLFIGSRGDLCSQTNVAKELLRKFSFLGLGPRTDSFSCLKIKAILSAWQEECCHSTWFFISFQKTLLLLTFNKGNKVFDKIAGRCGAPQARSERFSSVGKSFIYIKFLWQT